MKKSIKYITNKIIVGVILMALIFSTIIPSTVLADNVNKYMNEANYLNDLGLFLGGNDGFNLEVMPDRAQGAVMVVRLLGKESEALNAGYIHPFTDVPVWADPYVGYLYSHSITNGTGTTTYGSDNHLNATQYMTLMLRVLGYQDSNGDFLWHQSLDMAYGLGIISDSEYRYYLDQDDGFLRDDMVHFSYTVLFSGLKDSEISLYQRLVVEEAISPEEELANPDTLETQYPDTPVAENETPSEETEAPLEDTQDEQLPTPIEPIETPQTANIIPSSEIYYPYTNAALPSYVGSTVELQFAIETMVFMMLDTVTFNVGGNADFGVALEGAMDQIKLYPGYFSLVSGYGYSYTSNRITVEMYYNLTADEVMTARAKADGIIDSIITPGMNEFEMELAIHDYLLNYVRYTQNSTGNKPYTMYGALVEGSAVCQGYAEAFDYLCELVGLDAMVATGMAYQNGTGIRHAWNIVNIDGKYYQVDVTWDDPTTTNGSTFLRHYYFNITDDIMAKDHVLDDRTYPTCNSTASNYYYYNDRVVMDLAELDVHIRDGLQNKFSEIDVRCVDFSPSNVIVDNIINNHTDTGWATCAYSVNVNTGIVTIYGLTYR